MHKASFYIDGMTCSACSAGIERSLSRKMGVKKIVVNLISKTASIEFDCTKISLSEIFAFIEKLGYKPSTEAFDQARDQDIDRQDIKSATRFFSSISLFLNKLDSKLSAKTKVIASLILSMLVLYLAMVPMFYPGLVPNILLEAKLNSILQLMITLCVMHLGRNFYIKGFSTLLSGMPNMDTLIALGSGVSFVYSLYMMGGIFGFYELDFMPHLYFESVCVILAFVLLGKSLENYAKDTSLKELDTLDEFYQKKALKQDRDGSYFEIAFKDIKEDDVIKVLSGGIIPVDGIVIEGKSSIDESMLTGESLPVEKIEGSQVYAGSLNVDQVLIIKASKSCAFSTIAQIFGLTKTAQDSKAPIARVADVVAGYFVPIVIAFASIVFVYWWWARDFAFGMNIFVSILVVSCPCALGLAVPMAILIGSIKGLKNGILFKNAKVLENAHKVDVILFDKTGTLTKGNLEVNEILDFGKIDNTKILEVAKSLEEGSEHLIAKAILKYASGVRSFQVDGLENVVGYGVKGRVDGVEYRLGRLDFFENLDSKALEILDQYKDKMVILLARVDRDGDELLAAFLLEDRIKPESRYSIELLRNMGIKTMILSGDRESVVESVARDLGMDDYRANLKPQDKLEQIVNLKKEGKRVMMVGDGLNDAPALAQADIALAMGMGNDLSKEKSDIIVLSDHILSVVNVLRLSKGVLKNIKANLFWAFFYNIIAISLAAGLGIGFGINFNPMIAAFAMSLSSICVVLSAQRLYLFKFLKE